jgi:hypothetical protein
MHLRIEPTRVVECVGFNEAEFGHDGNIGDNWRAALWTELSLNRLTTIPRLGNVLSGPVIESDDFGTPTSTEKAVPLCF